MDAHPTIVIVTLAAKSSAETPKKARWEARSETMPCGSALVVLVVAAPPDAGFVSPLRGAVEPLVHAQKPVQSASVCRVGVIDDAVLEHERAHARSFACVSCRIGSA